MPRVELPVNVKHIISALQKNGYQAYAVGGCVRDSLFGKIPNDWDICTSALPEQVKEATKSVCRRYIETGLKHGTVTVVIDNENYEITTFRTDGTYSDGRHPDSVRFVSDLKEDLARRDFTVDAMAYSDEAGVVDCYGGQEDLQNGIIRCVGDPYERFAEDGLRILRALRFASTFGFEIESRTALAIHTQVHLLAAVSAERISSELVKLISGKGAVKILLDYADVITYIIPELKPCVGFKQTEMFHKYTVYDHIAHTVGHSTEASKSVKLAALLHDIAKPVCCMAEGEIRRFPGHPCTGEVIAKIVLQRLHLDCKTMEEVCLLVLHHDDTITPTPKSVRRCIVKYGSDFLFQLLDLKEADTKAHERDFVPGRLAELAKVRKIATELVNQEQCFGMKNLAIGGYDIVSLGVKPGKEIGKLLDMALDAVIDEMVPNEKEKLLAFCKQQIEEEKRK